MKIFIEISEIIKLKWLVGTKEMKSSLKEVRRGFHNFGDGE